MTKRSVDAQFLIEKLLDIVDNTEKENPQACLRAIELLGKTFALWKDRQEISGPDGQAIEMEQKVKQNVTEFTSTIAGLVKRAGEADIVEFPHGPRKG